jgi:hypothetical protein
MAKMKQPEWDVSLPGAITLRVSAASRDEAIAAYVSQMGIVKTKRQFRVSAVSEPTVHKVDDLISGLMKG